MSSSSLSYKFVSVITLSTVHLCQLPELGSYCSGAAYMHHCKQWIHWITPPYVAAVSVCVGGNVMV